MATTRTQAERSATTRQALLDATIACLVEEGYANTTTARVAERAGVSRGAHLHHFQTRSALVAAAVEHLRVRRAEELMAAADAALYRAKGCGRDQVQMISTSRGLSAVSSTPRSAADHAPSLFRRASVS